MRIGIIGRTNWLLETAQHLRGAGHDIGCVITAKAAEDYDITEGDFEKFAAAVGAPFLMTPRLNRAQAVDWIRGQGDMDLGISVNYPGIIGEEVIRLFSRGILNAHGGDLPRYRGNACQAWAIINGEKHIGLCVHKMVPGVLDSGDILAREYLPIDGGTRIGQVYEWMTKTIPKLMLESVVRLEEDPAWVLEVQSKDPADALRCYPRFPEDGRISWDWPRLRVLRLINASSEPYGGAFTYLGRERVVIWRAQLTGEDPEPWAAIPGQIAAIDREEGWIDVICGDGKVRIEEIELRGERNRPGGLLRSIRARFQ